MDLGTYLVPATSEAREVAHRFHQLYHRFYHINLELFPKLLNRFRRDHDDLLCRQDTNTRTNLPLIQRSRTITLDSETMINEDDNEETNDERLSDENANEEDVLPDVLDAGEYIDYMVFREAFCSGFLPTDDQSDDGEDPE